MKESLLCHRQPNNTILSFVDVRQHEGQSLNLSSCRTPGVLPSVSLTLASELEGRASSRETESIRRVHKGKGSLAVLAPISVKPFFTLRHQQAEDNVVRALSFEVQEI